MKIKLKHSLTTLILSLTIFGSCMTFENEGDGDWARVNIDILSPNISSNQDASTDSGAVKTYPSIMITAVSGSMTAVDASTDISDRYGRMLLKSDRTVVFTLPVNQSLRLIRSDYPHNPTIAEIDAGALLPTSIAISAPFTIDATTANTTVKIEMPSVTYNLTKDSYPKGVYKTSLTASKAYDPAYWLWNSPYIADEDWHNPYSAHKNRYFLENDNKTVSWIKALDTPLPWNGGNDSGESSYPFADGTFAGKAATTGWYRPAKAVLAYSERIDGSGDVMENQYTRRYEMDWNESTGCVNTITQSDWNPDSSEIETAWKSINIMKATSEIDYTSDYVNCEYYGYTSYDSSNDVTSLSTVVYTGTNTRDEVDYADTRIYYEADSTTLQPRTIDEVENVAKRVRTRILTGNVRTRTYQYYNGDDILVYWTEEEVTYANLLLWHWGEVKYKEVWIDPTTDVQTTADDYESSYTKGFLVKRIHYSTSTETGERTVASTGEWTRDSQGRTTSYVNKDASGDIDYRIDNEFYDNGTLKSGREYSVSNGEKTAVCTDYNNGNSYNFDYSYETDSSGNRTFTVLNFCDGTTASEVPGAVGTYQSSPNWKFVRTYNTMGLRTNDTQYSYYAAGSDPVLFYRKSWEYGTSGEMTKEQHYSVSNGNATPSYYYIYEYDDNLYRTAAKGYDADGDLSVNPNNTNSAYKCKNIDWSRGYANVNGYHSGCYEKHTYFYKLSDAEKTAAASADLVGTWTGRSSGQSLNIPGSLVMTQSGNSVTLKGSDCDSGLLLTRAGHLLTSDDGSQITGTIESADKIRFVTVSTDGSETSYHTFAKSSSETSLNDVSGTMTISGTIDGEAIDIAGDACASKEVDGSGNLTGDIEIMMIYGDGDLGFEIENPENLTAGVTANAGAGQLDIELQGNVVREKSLHGDTGSSSDEVDANSGTFTVTTFNETAGTLKATYNLTYPKNTQLQGTIDVTSMKEAQ